MGRCGTQLCWGTNGTTRSCMQLDRVSRGQRLGAASSTACLLQAYSLLARHAQNQGVPHWCIKPKHHHLWHGFEQARLAGHTPKSFWLFKHEDFVGIATRIGRLAHPASISLPTLLSWVLHWSMKADASKPVKRKLTTAPTRNRRRIKRIRRSAERPD